MAERPGVAVDSRGGSVVDPTANVRELVQAESKYQDYARDAESKRQDNLREAETRRVNDLAMLRREYDIAASENLRIQVKTTSDLISTQLDKVTAALGAQIASVTSTFAAQISTLTASINDRLAGLERFRWESGGRTSVSDPAMSEALKEMAAAVRILQSGGDKSSGAWAGIGQLVVTVIAVAGIGIALFAALHK